ncbi:MAG: PAS domain S-box protein, partial [Verrucomicrobia bacterium]|nr:PAS domain S-box protein [Verrucomicrobiota bacterium]
MKLEPALASVDFSLAAFTRQHRHTGWNGIVSGWDPGVNLGRGNGGLRPSGPDLASGERPFPFRGVGEERGEDLLELLDRLPEAIFLLDPEDALEPAVETSQFKYGGHPRPYKWSLSWPIRNCNEPACRLNGYTREELIGQPAGLVGPITDEAEVLTGLAERLRREKCVRLEALHCRKDRTLFPVEASFTRVLAGQQPLILCVERELPRWKLPGAGHDKHGLGSGEGINPVLEFDAEGHVTYYNAAAHQLAVAWGQASPVTLVPPGMPALVKTRLESGTHLLGLETRLGGRTLSWALFPNPAMATVYAYVSEVTGCLALLRPPGPASEPVEPGTGRDAIPGGQGAPGDAEGTEWRVRPEPALPLVGDGEMSPAELLQAAGDALIAFDLEEKIHGFNPAAEALTGYPAAAVLGRTYSSLNLLTPESLAAMSDVLQRVKSGRETAPLEQVMVDKQGRRVVVETNFRALRQGNQVRGVVATLRDLTARKLGEEYLRLSDASLVLAQHVAKLGSWEWRGDPEHLEWSPETFRIFGCDSQRFTPTRSAVLALVHPANRELVKQTAETAWRTGSAYRLEYRIVQPDGAQRLIQEQAEVMTDDKGGATRMIGAVQDITERKQQEEQLRHLEKWEAIGRLAGGVAHDFNNILADIRRCIEVIQASTPEIKEEMAVQLKSLATTAERA